MSFQEWGPEVVTAFREYAPLLLGAAVTLLVGWLVARLVRGLIRRVVSRTLGQVEHRWGIDRAVEDSGVRSTIPWVVSVFAFWVVLLFFAASALELLGLEIVSGVVSRLTYYLPNLLGATGVVVGGVVLGKLARTVVASAARSAGIARPEEAGRLARAALLMVAVVVALDQIGVDAQLLVVLMAVVVGASFAGAALAFGLGARTAVSNIIGAYYASQTYRVGQAVRIGEVEGRIVQTTPTAVLLDTADGQVLVPARRFSEDASVLLAGRS